MSQRLISGWGLTAVILILFMNACTAAVEEPAAPPSQAATAVPTRLIADTAGATASPIPSATLPPTPPPVPSPTPVRPTPTAVPLPPIPVRLNQTWETAGQWGGVLRAIALDGSTAFVGMGPRLASLEVSDAAKPRLLGRSQPLADLVHQVILAEDLAFLAAGRAGVAVLDVSDPAAPQVVGQLNTFDGREAHINSIARDGSTLFAATRAGYEQQNYLFTLDVSDPAAPRWLAAEELPGPARLVTGDGVLYVVGYGFVQLRPLAEPATILETYTFEGGSWDPNLLLVDGTAYLSPAYYNQLRQFDVSTAGEFAPSGVTLDLMMAGVMAYQDETLYLSGIFGEFGYCSSTISAVDVASPGQLELLTEWDPQNCVTDMAAADGRLYVTGRSGLQIYDITDRQNPQLRATFTAPGGFFDAQTVAVQGDTVLITSAAGRGSTLHSLAGDTAAGSPLSLEAGYINGDFILDAYYILPVWGDGLRVVDIGDPVGPVLAAALSQSDLPLSDMLATAVQDHTLYIPVTTGGVGEVGIVDLQDPTRPALQNILHAAASYVTSLGQADGRLFVFSQEAQYFLEIFDLADPAHPVRQGEIELSQPFGLVTAVEDTLYVACAYGNCHELALIDTGDPANPALQAIFPLPLEIVRMVPGPDHTLYLLTRTDGLWALDVTNPQQPILSGHTPLPANPVDLTLDGDQIWVATGEAGLILLR